MQSKNGVKRPRPSHVCDNCKRRKQKCDKNRPSCRRCLKLNQTCVYPDLNGSNVSNISPVSDSSIIDDIKNSNDGNSSLIHAVNNQEGKIMYDKNRHFSINSMLDHRSNHSQYLGNNIRTTDSGTSENPSTENKERTKELEFSSTMNTTEKNYSENIANMLTNSSAYQPINEITPESLSASGRKSLECNGETAYDSILAENDLDDMILELFNPNNMIVVYGNMTYIDSPFALHTLAQLDAFARALCGALHGNTMIELHSKLLLCPQANNYAEMLSQLQPPSPVAELNSELSTLPYIKQSIIKWVESSEKNQYCAIAIGLSHKTVSLDETMSPQLYAGLQLLVYDIENKFTTVVETEYILKNFFENIYPFYPFMELCSFKSNLNKICETSENGRYKFNIISKNNSQSDFETFCLFNVVLAISFRQLMVESDVTFLKSKDVESVIKNLYSNSQKLLIMLDTYKNTNESSFCCELYAFLLSYLEPNAELTCLTHEKIGRLKSLNEIALTLGLHHNPSKYTRYFNELEPDPKILKFRRKLWLGLNTLKMEILIPNGVANRLDIDHMNAFISPERSLAKILQNDFHSIGEIDASILQRYDNKYQLQLILNELVISCTPVSNNVHFGEVVQNLKRAKNFLIANFSITDCEMLEDQTLLYKVDPNIEINLKSTKNVELIINYINGYTCIMCVYFVLATKFEELSRQDWRKYEKYYHKFLIEAIESNVKLDTLVMGYLEGKYAKFVDTKHRYVLDRIVSNLLIKLWTLKSCFLTRFSYKRYVTERLERKYRAEKMAYPEANLLPVLIRIINLLNVQMYRSVELLRSNISAEYYTRSYCSPMFQYIVNIIEKGKLVEVVNKFWDRTFEAANVPSLLLKSVNMKWGLDMKNPQIIKYHLISPEGLQCMNKKLLEGIENVLNVHLVDCRDCEAIWDSNEVADTASTESGNFDQFFETNFDLFLGAFNNSLGDFPKITFD
ncbi:uncharacterized protein HLK63_D02651 [Nakaseomyces glabratus]|nr:uncharacterized protein GW608_D02651 [Nakaseomyces glabratus]UCS24733.1 uncharacterized protein HLK63_D02651 [Nakaseomyces glabratus]UCS29963.1 uncharacterized protein HLK64_D02651 [Nakaseomyces glabratus]UCS35191.1 uncharacterized protein HLK62_D02651 [Nakaseomyces glabratus]